MFQPKTKEPANAATLTSVESVEKIATRINGPKATIDLKENEPVLVKIVCAVSACNHP